MPEFIIMPHLERQHEKVGLLEVGLRGEAGALLQEVWPGDVLSRVRGAEEVWVVSS